MSPTIEKATPDAIARAASRIRSGGLVAFPTETVYGLGADATSDHAVSGIFEAKHRPSFNPLICHFADLDAVAREAEIPDAAMRLADTFWPGSLTLVLARRADSAVSLLASAGLETVAARIPDHPVAADLLKRIQRPVAAPSANRSGELSPTHARHVAESLAGEDVLILDGGPCRVGIESTVVAVEDNGSITLLREGGIAREDLEATIRMPVRLAAADDEGPKAPGMLSRHYATDLPLRMDAVSVAGDEFLIVLGPLPDDRPSTSVSLSPTGDLREAAANLFDVLHRAGQSGCRSIAVAPIPDAGLGRAINDRLRRSAAAAGSGS